MKIKSVIKRITLYSSILTMLFLVNSSNIRKNSKSGYHITAKISKNKIEYSKGTIYIGSRAYLNSINDLSEYDVLVLDNRTSRDPDVKIYDSHKITSPELREEIIDGLLLYEEAYPTPWNRTRNSLIREWSMHNIMHSIGYKHDSTTDVDLNNADEKQYRIRR